MAFKVELASKQPGESKTYLVDFSNAFSEGETIAAATAVAYKWDSRDQVDKAYDLTSDYPTADQAVIGLYGCGLLLHQEELSLAVAHTDLLVKAVNDDAWIQDNEFIVGGTLGWNDTTVWLRATGGIAGHTYKITIKGTTSDSNVFEADLVIPVEEL